MNHRSIAAPLLDPHGGLIGGLNASVPMRKEGSVDAVARVLLETARATRNLI